jgi:hypothetical protein
VIARKDSPGGCALVAYVVPSQDSSITAGELRRYLGNYLQDAFIPSAFVFLEHLPLLPNGKVDRHALPSATLNDPEPGQNFVMPRTPVEKILAESWQAVLGIERVGIYDNFFELGGHSLLMTQIAYRVSVDTGVDIPLASFFRSPTIFELAILVSDILISGADQVEI